MLKNPFYNLVGHKENIKTYNLIRLQGKSYRFIKNYINEFLSANKLSSLEWGILGLLYENADGMQYREIAQSMGVEPPFITELISKLQKLNVIKIKDSEKDKRSKLVSLTEKGKKHVETIEKNLKEKFTSHLKDISPNEWSDFLDMLRKIDTIATKQQLA